MAILGMSTLAVGVTMTVVVSLALFLTLLVLLLADLFCAHLRRRRAASQPKRAPSPPHTPTADDASVVTTQEALSSTPPFYYAHGVLQAPKDLVLGIPKMESATWRWSPARRSSPSESATSSSHSDRFVYISNPVYERSGAVAAAGGETPFETPDASPAPLANGEVEEEGDYSPPLTVMKKLPPVFSMGCAPPVPSFHDGVRMSMTGSGTVITDTNRASSSSSNVTHFFTSW